ncbi:MAG: trypsin-like peptidase domain-containing protein [Kofleriaceae bacterium]|jgi:S1-C subfamily serine protease|nr:trypsin-like peptidase domain-containing protein [Kofleriaceae bacterium]MBP9170163.1 trypsin-like peptidase domain-containing protein [Kofleriaceae bacterium]MBP9859842.1 trypsin-like peptidase domain-containing protein [Kofleriaceae bacterium]
MTPTEPPAPAGPESSLLTKLLAVMLLLVAAALVFTVMKMRRMQPEVVYESRPVAPPAGELGADEKATITVFKTVSPSVVHITNIAQMRNVITSAVDDVPQGTGSGFIWDDAGHIVTNFHVIEGATSTEVTLADGSTYEGKIIGTARDKDLAVIKIEAPPSKLAKIMVGTSADLQVGQKVLAIGNPFGLDQTLTTGVISGLGREITSRSQRKIYDVVQTDAPINPGNSGGPLLDGQGRLIGVNTAIYSPSGASAGIGFAVPVDTVNLVVPQILNLKGEVRPVLGINLLSDGEMRQIGVTGVGIRNVARGGPADRAGLSGLIQGRSGLELGDVITKIDGSPVVKTADLFKVLDRRRIGDVVELEISRNGDKRSVKVTLEVAR